ncbi:YciI family protein [Pantoea tagorei]
MVSPSSSLSSKDKAPLAGQFILLYEALIGIWFKVQTRGQAMLFVIRFTDRSAQLSVRERYFDAHIAWLQRKRDVIKIAGSLREKHSDHPVGALWVVEAATEDDAFSIFADDPFWVHGLRASVEIHSWSLAFSDMLAEASSPSPAA